MYLLPSTIGQPCSIQIPSTLPNNMSFHPQKSQYAFLKDKNSFWHNHNSISTLKTLLLIDLRYCNKICFRNTILTFLRQLKIF